MMKTRGDISPASTPHDPAQGLSGPMEKQAEALADDPAKRAADQVAEQTKDKKPVRESER